MSCKNQLRLPASAQLIALICDSLRRLAGPAWRAGGEESMRYGIYVKRDMRYRAHRSESVLAAQLDI